MNSKHKPFIKFINLRKSRVKNKEPGKVVCSDPIGFTKMSGSNR
jgi:hypothetical protein